MSCSADSSPGLADHFAFVLGAYLTAFGTWAAASAYDYITDTWRTVKSTRERGVTHLATIIMPMTYMLAYITVQAKSCDYKEMSTGIVALLFACWDFCRTVFGLWQLHIFRQWVVSSVRSLESLGYVAEGHGPGGKELSRLYQIADDVKVNESIAENRVSEGAVKCHLRSNLQFGESFNGQTIYYFLKLLHFIPRLLYDIAVSNTLLFTHPKSPLYLHPHEPEEVWLRWACVLVSQVFPGWLQEMKKSKVSGFVPGDSFKQQSAHFGRGVLLSAAIHTQKINEPITPTVARNCLSPHSFLNFKHWHKYPKLCRGVFSEQEMLGLACSTGNGLPFQVPHSKCELKKDGKLLFGYGKFKGKLDRTVGMLPVDEAEKLEGFGIGELEWLAIFLSVSDWSVPPNTPDSAVSSKESEEDHSVSSQTKSNTFSDIEESGRVSMLTSTSASGATDTNKNSEHLGHGDDVPLCVENIQYQLGAQNYDEAPAPLKWGLRSSFPLIELSNLQCFNGNRTVLETSVHIDNFLALFYGDQYNFMVSEGGETSRRLSEARKQIGYDRSDIFEAGHSFLEAYEPKSFLHEKERLKYQFAHSDPEFSYLEQGMTFLGCSMENLRSSLARWVASNSESQKSSWNPTMKFPAENISFQTSESFSACMNTNTRDKPFSSRHIQMRLVWELQSYFHRREVDGALSPSQPHAMILCLLSFPGLQVIMRSPNDDESKSVVSETGSQGEYRLLIDSNSEQNINVAIRVPFSPQDLHLSLSLTRREDTVWFVSVTIEVNAGCFEDTFEWEKWRDDFLFRLESIREWQKTHDLPWVHLVKSPYCISRGVGEIAIRETGTGEKMKVWLGWLPHRTNLCQFEVESEDFIHEKRELLQCQGRDAATLKSMVLTKTKYLPVKYEFATRLDLEYASSIAAEAILHVEKQQLFAVDGNEILTHIGQDSSRKKNHQRERRVRMHNEIVDHRKMFDSLQLSCTPSGQGQLSPSEVRNAVRMIERFCSVAGRETELFEMGQPSFEFEDQELAMNVLSLLLSLQTSSHTSYYPSECVARLVTSFANYDESSTQEIVSTALRKSIMCCYQTSPMSKIGQLQANLGSISYRARPEDDILPFLLVVCGLKKTWVYDGHFSSLGHGLLEGAVVSVCPPLAMNAYFLGAHEENDALCLHDIAYISQNRARGTCTRQALAVQLYSQVIERVGLNISLTNLAVLLEYGSDEVDADAPRAVALYTRAIEEEKSSKTMHNLALLLENGAPGVPADPIRACTLYNESIMEGNTVLSYYNLAGLLMRGADGVEPDPQRAIKLYQEYIDSEGCTETMRILASILLKGAEGQKPDPDRAVRLYEEVLDITASVDDMCCLADILSGTQQGVKQDPSRAVALYNQAIETDLQSGIVGLCRVLLRGAEGVDQDHEQAAQLCNRLLDEEVFIYVGYELGCLLCEEAESFKPGISLGARMFERAVRYRDDVPAMNRLGLILYSGTEGVEADPPRGLELFKKAITAGIRLLTMEIVLPPQPPDKEEYDDEDIFSDELQTAAVEEEAYAVAMVNLAIMLNTDTKDRVVDPWESVEGYIKAREEDGKTEDIYRMAVIMHTEVLDSNTGDTDDFDKVKRLYRWCIDERDRVDAMYGLALLLNTELYDDGKYSEEAIKLRATANKRETHSSVMKKIANLTEFNSSNEESCEEDGKSC